MSKELEGEIALVTGACRGIGKAIAEQLAAQGATVIGTATSDGGADNISAYLSNAGGKGMCLNVTDVDSIATVMKAITDEFGAVSILVNNAGITKDNLLMAMKEEQWNDIIETNQWRRQMTNLTDIITEFLTADVLEDRSEYSVEDFMISQQLTYDEAVELHRLVAEEMNK